MRSSHKQAEFHHLDTYATGRSENLGKEGEAMATVERRLNLDKVMPKETCDSFHANVTFWYTVEMIIFV